VCCCCCCCWRAGTKGFLVFFESALVAAAAVVAVVPAPCILVDGATAGTVTAAEAEETVASVEWKRLFGMTGRVGGTLDKDRDRRRAEEEEEEEEEGEGEEERWTQTKEEQRVRMLGNIRRGEVDPKGRENPRAECVKGMCGKWQVDKGACGVNTHRVSMPSAWIQDGG